MPIQFRCTSCNQKLAITRRKAGKVVTCPACQNDLQVPTLEEAKATGALIESPPEPSEPPQSSPSPPVEDRLPEGALDDLFDDEPLDEEVSEAEPPVEEPIADAPPLEEVPAAPSPAEDERPSEEQADRSESTAPASIVGAALRRWDEEEVDEEEGFHLGRRASDESGLDMTPMVDVTFLLLIFFMITASFSVQKSMEAEAPEPDKDAAAQLPHMEDLADDSVIVEIDENDAIYVDDEQVASLQELEDVLAQKIGGEGKSEMIIEAHPQAKHGTVVQVTDAGIDVDMQRIRRVTRSGE